MLTSSKVISRWATDVYETSKVLVEKIDESLNKSMEAMNQSLIDIKEYEKTIEQTFTLVENKTIELQTNLVGIFVEKSDTHHVSDMLGYTFLIPLTLVGLSFLGLTMIAISWTFYMSQHRHDALQSRRGAVSIVAASILATAGYTAMLVGALLCVLAA
ncbi:unnamed protein product [Strongylus vulgaris]|uniref:Uncharacterized protein n=1 Tax=Strongylus vulgaris TaxID=40348 RepID=A0A3P7ITP5_STRVU|nr:unnamed protein product [Strongylus vulgaris]